MATAGSNQQALSPIFRLDTPDALDLQAIEAAAAKPQRGAWRYLGSIFETAQKRYCRQFSIEPDATLWRLRYRRVDGYEEHVLDDPSVLIWAIDALQVELWGDEYHKNPNRSMRFTWTNKTVDQAVTFTVLPSVNGDVMHFDLEHLRPIPALLEEMGLTPAQLLELRLRLAEQHGMILLTSPEPAVLNDLLLAINQDLISPDRKLLSIHNRHRYSLPRTMQIDLPVAGDNTLCDTWQNALDTHYDTLLIHASVPAQFHERVANNCDQGGLTVQALRVTRAADLIDMLNASVVRRAPLHRAVTSVISHYPVRSLCSHCSERADLNDAEQVWLEQLRTPVTENVIGWLADGNREQFKTALGCHACANTGEGAPLAVFDILHRDEQTNLFPNVGSVCTGDGEQINYLQRQLMSLAKIGSISLTEVIRIVEAC